MRTEGSFDVLHWYAIQTKPKQEERADRNLSAWRVETFTPRVRGQRLISGSGKLSHSAKPLFSRYIFARFKASNMLHKVCFTRGVQSVVCFGGIPSLVDDKIIEFMKSRRDKDGFVRLCDELSYGDKVMIMDGHLKDFVGIFEREMTGQERVSILLTTINYQGRVLIERAMVKKVV
jgi:transcriptional antiterminator RfaH